MSGRPSTSTPTRPVAIKGTRLPRDAALREEQVDEYAPGGYRQIHVGDVLNCGRYRVVRKLGFGHFSTVWLVRDQRRNKHVALKVVKSAFKYAQTAIDEVALLRIIQSPDRGGLNHPGRRHIVEFLDCFALHPTRGPDALLSLDRDDPTPRHVCMTFEPLGENLLTLMKRLATCDATNLKIGVPTALVQQIIRQVLQALAYLHDHCGLIHTDLKLENIIVQVEDVEELVEACEVEEGALGVSPTNATRTVPFKEPVTSQSPTVSTPGGAGGVLGALGRERSGSTRMSGLAALSSSPREITITGSAPLPSPLHPWGRVNTGPEVNNLALIMAQVKLQRRLTEESLRTSDQRRSASSDASPPLNLTGSPPSFDISSSPADMHQPPPQSKSHPLPNISRLHPPSHTPSQTLHHRRTWAAPAPATSSTSTNPSPPPSGSQNLASTSSSYNSNTSSATLFSMTHSQGEMSASTSTMSSAPTSLENSLVLSAVVDGVRTMKILDEGAEKKTSGSSSRPQQYDWTSAAAFDVGVPVREGSGGMLAPFSFEMDPAEESVAPSAVPLGTSGPRLRNDLDLMLASSSMDFPSSPPVFGPAARTPTTTPTPHQPVPTATSLLTARKPKNIDAASAAALNMPFTDEGSGDSTPTLISDHSVSASPFSASSPPPQRGRAIFGKPLPASSSSSRPRAPPRIHVKIADLGNATPIAKHFTPDIQTRPYRAPEVILGHKNWDQSVDIWSVGCILFELLTSDLLFFAEEDKKGNRYSRDDDHLAQIVELMGDFPWARKWGGRYSKDFFNPQGGLRRIAKMRPWSIRAVLSQKYDYPHAQAEKLRAFLLPMLALDPAQRPSAAELAQHPWLDDEDAAPPYALDRVSAEDEFYRVNDAKLAGVLQALEDVEGELGEA